MQVYRISKCRYIKDLSGAGSARFPGRWHSKGTHVLYTAGSPSLALLESVVHLSGIVLESYCLLSLDIPVNSIAEVHPDIIDGNWHYYPAPSSLRQIGDQFVRDNKYLALRVPSAIIPEESNYLINPGHKDFAQVSMVFQRELDIDRRLIKGKV